MSHSLADLIAAGVLDSDLQKIEHEIQKECDDMLQKQQERREYAEKCMRANMEYEKQVGPPVRPVRIRADGCRTDGDGEAAGATSS